MSRACAVCVLLSVATAAQAHAHAGHRSMQTVVRGVSPGVQGVSVEGVPGLFGKLRISTRGAARVTVVGDGGRPMFRVGPGGVEANRNSPDWHRDNEPLGIARVPPNATPDAAVAWERVSRLRSWEWFDHRLHPAGATPGPWSIPLRSGARRAAIRGRSQAGSAELAFELDKGSQISGVTLKLVPQPTASLVLRNDGERPVTIMGTRGEVFARVGPRGVEVNVHSPVWLPTAQHRNRDMLAWVIDPAAEPEFELITTRPELVWPDPRLLPDDDLPVGAAEPTAVARWSIPLRVGGTPGNATALEGVTTLDPTPAAQKGPGAAAPTEPGSASSSAPEDDGGPLGTILLAGLALAVIVGAGVARARRRRGS